MAEHTKLCYRRLKPSDEHELIKFLYKQWHLPDKTSELSPAKLLARSYLYQLLGQQSRTYIAALNGQIVGVIMGRNQQLLSVGRQQQPPNGQPQVPGDGRRQHPLSKRRHFTSSGSIRRQDSLRLLRLKTRQAAVKLLLSRTQNGRDCQDLLQCLNETDDALVKNCVSAFDGELVFFMVDEPYRGRGIGTSLLGLLHQYMRRVGVRKMYVLTDTGCDYDFYDRHKFSRLMKKSVELPSERLKFTCYMYQYCYHASPARRIYSR